MNQKSNLHQPLRQPLTNPSEKIVILLKSIQKKLKEHLFEKSKQYGFTGPQMYLIFTLYKNPGSNLNEVSEMLGLSKSTVSGIVDRLVSQNVVIREIPEENRRTVRLSLSPDFTNKFDPSEIKNKYLAGVIKDVDEEELYKIIAGLEKLDELMNENKDPE